MCGLLGIFSQNPIDGDQLAKAAQCLVHRGPEELGIWFSADKKIGLAHNRLAIIDVVAGHQPLFSENGNIIAIVNGEFYDYEKIREDLIAKGHHFKTHSDSE